MEFNHEQFHDYIQQLQVHLFDNLPFEDIVKLVDNDHRSSRLVSMYLLQDQETFHRLYAERKGLGIESIFNHVISALFHETDKHLFKQELISRLAITRDMATADVSSYEMKVVMKDVHAFMMWAWKQDPNRGEPPWLDRLSQKFNRNNTDEADQ